MIKMKEKNCCEVEDCFVEIDDRYNFCWKHCKHLNFKEYDDHYNTAIKCDDCNCDIAKVSDNLLGNFIMNLFRKRGGETNNEKNN